MNRLNQVLVPFPIGCITNHQLLVRECSFLASFAQQSLSLCNRLLTNANRYYWFSAEFLKIKLRKEWENIYIYIYIFFNYSSSSKPGRWVINANMSLSSILWIQTNGTQSKLSWKMGARENFWNWNATKTIHHQRKSGLILISFLLYTNGQISFLRSYMLGRCPVKPSNPTHDPVDDQFDRETLEHMGYPFSPTNATKNEMPILKIYWRVPTFFGSNGRKVLRKGSDTHVPCQNFKEYQIPMFHLNCFQILWKLLRNFRSSYFYIFATFTFLKSIDVRLHDFCPWIRIKWISNIWLVDLLNHISNESVNTLTAFEIVFPPPFHPSR